MRTMSCSSQDFLTRGSWTEVSGPPSATQGTVVRIDNRWEAPPFTQQDMVIPPNQRIPLNAYRTFHRFADKVGSDEALFEKGVWDVDEDIFLKLLNFKLGKAFEMTLDEFRICVLVSQKAGHHWM